MVSLSLQYSVMASDGMTSNSATNIRIRIHLTHLQCTQFLSIDCLESFQDIDNYTYDVDILPSRIDIKFELMYPPAPSFDPSPN